MAVGSVHDFLSALAEYQLLKPAQLKQLQGQVEGQDVPSRAVAQSLIQQGWLTPYQVNQIFQGRGKDLLLGPYVVLERLGEGGMGQVFKGQHQLMDRVVALKLIRKDRLGDAGAAARFLREIKAAGQLSHPNIVLAHDAAQLGDSLLLVMEYVEGTDLARLVKQQGPLPLEQACAYIRQAAWGLAHAHERGLVHRDIKPHNLLVNFREGVVKVVDMGLVRQDQVGDDATAELTNTGTVMGTPDYISPEQAKDPRAVDSRCDLYSLGCTLYFLLAGQPPFPGGALGAKLMKHLVEEPEPVERLRPAVPAPLAAVLRRMMAKRPQDRFQTAAEVVDALAPFAGGGQRNPKTAGQRQGLSPPLAQLVTPQVKAALLLNPSRGPTTSVATDGTLACDPADFATGPVAGLGPAVKGGVRRALQLVGPVFRGIFTALRPWGARAVHWFRALPRWAQFAAGGVALILLIMIVAVLDTRPPLDRLRAADIPALDRLGWQPKELVAVLDEHKGRHWHAWVGCAAFSPDGKTLASSGWDRTVRLWDVATMGEKACLRGHTREVRWLAISPDGKQLASASYDKTVRLWDISGPEPKAGAVLQGHQFPVECVAFSPDGKLLASGSHDFSVRIWESSGGKERGVLKGHGAVVTSVAFAPDGQTLASASHDQTVRLWDPKGGQASEPAVLSHAPSSVHSVAFAPDGQTLATGSNNVRLWDLKAKEPTARAVLPGHAAAVRGVAFSPDGKTLASASDDQTVRLWDLSRPAVKERILRGHTNWIHSVAFGPDGETLASAGWDGVVRLWDWSGPVPKERPLYPGATGGVVGVTVSADGKTLIDVLANHKPGPGPNEQRFLVDALKLWDLATRKQRASFRTGPVHALAPDGQSVAASEGEGIVRLWDTATGKERASLAHNRAQITAVAYSSDNRFLAVGSGDRYIRIWHVRDGSLYKEIKGFPEPAVRLAFSPDGTTLTSAHTKALTFWNLATGQEKGSVPWLEGTLEFPHHRLEYTSDGKTLVAWCHIPGVLAAGLKILDATSLQGREILPPQIGASAFSLSPDGKIVALFWGDWPEVRLFELATGKELPRLKAGSAWGVAWSPDSKRLVTRGGDGWVILWDTVLFKKIGDWQYPGPVTSASFDPTGRYLLTGNGNVYILRLPAESLFR